MYGLGQNDGGAVKIFAGKLFRPKAGIVLNRDGERRFGQAYFLNFADGTGRIVTVQQFKKSRSEKFTFVMLFQQLFFGGNFAQNGIDKPGNITITVFFDQINAGVNYGIIRRIHKQQFTDGTSQRILGVGCFGRKFFAGKLADDLANKFISADGGHDQHFDETAVGRRQTVHRLKVKKASPAEGLEQNLDGSGAVVWHG